MRTKRNRAARTWWVALLGGLLTTGAHAQLANWTNTIAGTDSTDSAKKVLVDATGNVIVLSTVNNTNADIRVVKYNVGGTQLWTRTINGSGNDADFANDMALDTAGNVYVCGAINLTTGYAAKLSAAAGTVTWSYTEGQTFSPFYSIAVNAAGNVAIGMVRNTSGDQYAVRQLNGTTGASIWDSDVAPNSIAGGQPRVITDGTSNTILVTESNLTKWTSAGVQSWQQTFTDPIDVMGLQVRDASNAIYYTGTYLSGPDQDWYVARRTLDTGALVWGKLTNFEASSDDTPSAMRLDGAGNPIVVGTVFNAFGQTDAAVVCYRSNDGGVAWVNTYNSPTGANDFANNLIIDGSSNIFMIGTARTATRYDVLIRKMDGLGATQWTTTLNNSTANANDFGRSIAFDAVGHVYAFGMYQRAAGNEARVTRLQQATLTPATPTINGGNSVVWTIALNSANPTSRVFSLSSSSPSATVPATVTMAAAATSATFTMTSVGVSVPTPVTVTASGIVGTVTINPPTPASVVVNPGDIVSGTSSTGTVNINGKAPAGGFTVFIKDNSSAVTVPSSVIVDAGATFAQFDISTVPTAVDVPATITATSSGVSVTTTLQVRRATLTSVSVSPASVTGGTPVTGRLVLSGIAGANFAVTLSSSNTSAAVMPSSSIVTRNFQEGTFAITTKAVGTDATVTVTAVLNGVTRTATLTVTAPTLVSVAGSPQSVPGGTPITGTLTLSNVSPATGTFPVTLSSSNASAVTVPASVNLTNNSSTTTFPITTLPVPSTVAVTITATFNSVTKTGSVTSRASGLSAVDFTADSVKGGQSTTGIIRMDGKVGAGGILVTLSSSNPAVATVPATVRIPAGATSATFTVTTTAVGTDTTVVVSATRNAITKTAELVVFP